MYVVGLLKPKGTAAMPLPSCSEVAGEIPWIKKHAQRCLNVRKRCAYQRGRLQSSRPLGCGHETHAQLSPDEDQANWCGGSSNPSHVESEDGSLFAPCQHGKATDCTLGRQL